MLQRTLNKIESKRKSNKFGWKFLVKIKDLLWQIKQFVCDVLDMIKAMVYEDRQDLIILDDISPFKKKVLSILNKNKDNNFKDLHYIPSFNENFKKRIIPRMRYTEKLLLKMPYFYSIVKLYENLADLDSRNLLEILTAYKIAGATKIKLPLYNKPIWEKYKELEKLMTGEGLDKSIIGNFNYYNLKSLGYNIKIFYPQYGVFLTYLLKQYEYKNICKVKKGDYVIDGGAGYGDSALYFADLAGSNGKVFSFEFIEKNIKIFKKNMDLNKNLDKTIELIEHPLSNISGDLVFSLDNGPASSVSNKPSENSKEYRTISIDDMVKEKKIEKIDFIKMDIEGSEIEALNGAKETIKKFKPTLAIAIYHKKDDFETIPLLIKRMNPNYKLYLKHLTVQGGETVLFAKEAN